mmetsp:Transcript_31865/g.66498  ORF Transcript_31865/g.66498 Transcript_31865/m.66498 type:complete len:193 (-) Transcript_31865:262-840(-)|eukprot:CAMPEP_0172441812 /NCGR_PEP_ID=MMETSP1065-20121228/2319_1 /TAXON_ID=265537 /ORGANISM="Amphiprora paludosa, Strain CCMP125" /LENGTH=192 /DNA_ID=CAMNT_0013191371 /DNA_START=197 /DNA_END=775 /DNA_ORIENTATION=+
MTAFAATRRLQSSLKNLPPHVQQELLRHVGAAPPKTATASNKTMENIALQQLKESRKSSLNKTLAGTLLFVAFTASLPMICSYWIDNLTEKEDALTAAQVRRGAFMNSGSRDVGRDPDWDLEQHKHKYEKGYGELTPERIPTTASQSKLARLLAPMDPGAMQEYSDKHGDTADNASASLAAAARGLPPQKEA